MAATQPQADRRAALAGRIAPGASVHERPVHADEEDTPALTRLTGRVAHQFNNLLAIIGASAELLENDDSDSRAEAARDILIAATEGRRLVRQLMAFGSHQILHPLVINLCEQLGVLLHSVRQRLPTNVELVVRHDPEDLAVRIDPAQLRSVVMALIDNSVSAMPDGGRLTIDIEAVHLHGMETQDLLPYVMLAVTDTGSGMGERVRQRAFDPFFSTCPERLGMGLASVRGIVRQSGGAVRIDSAPNEGTSAVVYFPQVTSAWGQPTPRSVRVPMRKRKRKLAARNKILLVDDDASVRRATRRLLVAEGFEVLEAASAYEALALVKAHAHILGLVISDITMPGMNGVELAELLREEPEGPEVLLTSGDVPENVRSRSEDELAFPFLQKPATRRELLDAVRAALNTPPG
jgi:CheY-like chemotaxis protein